MSEYDAPIDYCPRVGLSYEQWQTVKGYLSKKKPRNLGTNIDWLIELVDNALQSHAKEKIGEAVIHGIERRMAAIFQNAAELIEFAHHDVTAPADAIDGLFYKFDSIVRSFDASSEKTIALIQATRLLASMNSTLSVTNSRGRPEEDTQLRRVVYACYHYAYHQDLRTQKYVQKGDSRSDIGELIFAVADAFGIEVVHNEIAYALGKYGNFVRDRGQSMQSDFTSILADFPPPPENEDELSGD